MTAVTVVIIVLASFTTAATMPMVIAPTAIPATAMPAPAFAMVPAETGPRPAIPIMPAAAIPEHRSAVEPAIVMRSANRDTFKLDRTIVDRIATIALVIVVVPVAR